MKVNYLGEDLNVDIIGTFKISNKEYAVCSYEDDDANYKIVIVQIFRNGNDVHVRNIPRNEIDTVLAFYKKIENELLGGDE